MTPVTSRRRYLTPAFVPMLGWGAVLIMLQACASAPTAPVVAPLAKDASEAWTRTIQRVVPCIVTLRLTVPRDFDTYQSGTTEGTGFVVDKQRGLILTNRHLVKAGPVVAEAVLYNQEEIELHEVYRDPVHDFGFYRFDPADVSYPDLCELELAPERAQIGTDIRIIGNDAGEQVSILAGTLARLDRDAPSYGRGRYNDFNTFYYQAASGTSGGSSGSPVIDVSGRVVALNAGGSQRAASSFYLPLDRVVRALRHIQQGQTVPRGSLLTVFDYTSFDELRRLSLSPTAEAEIKQHDPDTLGMLVVKNIVPQSAADGPLQTGDILRSVNGQPVASFIPLEAALDDHVGSTVTLDIERRGQPRTVTLPVADLHESSPREYLEVSRAIVHPLSLMDALSYHVPLRGIKLKSQGYMFDRGGIPAGAILTEIDDRPAPTLDALQAILRTIPDGKKFRVRYTSLRGRDTQRERVGVVTMDRRWNLLERCQRNDHAGHWQCTYDTSAPAPEAAAPSPSPKAPSTNERPLASALVRVRFDSPYPTEGLWERSLQGAGVIVDATRGLVVTARSTVPIALGDIEITFNGTTRIPGDVVFIHPIHNLTLIAYDPKAVAHLPLRAVPLDETPLEQGDPVTMTAIDHEDKITRHALTINRVSPILLPVNPRRAEFRDANIEAVDVDRDVPSLGGVISDARGKVRALWLGFHYTNSKNKDVLFYAGLPANFLSVLLNRRNPEGGFTYQTLGIECEPTSLARARELGLDEAWIQKLAEGPQKNTRAMVVRRITTGFPAAEALQTGDVLLAINDQPIRRFIDLERATQAEQLRVTVLRRGTLQTLDTTTLTLNGQGITRVLSWAGGLFHAPPLEIASQYGVARVGVYNALFAYGGPTGRYKLYPTYRILEINGEPTPNLDAMIEVVQRFKDRDVVHLKVAELNRREKIITLKLDLRFYPTALFERTSRGWQRQTLQTLSTPVAPPASTATSQTQPQ